MNSIYFYLNSIHFYHGLVSVIIFSWTLPQSSFFHGHCLRHDFFMDILTLPQSAIYFFSWTWPQLSFCHEHSLNFASVIILFLATVMESNALADPKGRKLA